MTYEQMWTKVRDAVEKDLGHAVDDEYVTAFVRASIDTLGFHISESGEVCDPRPAPPTYSEQSGPAYSKYSRGRRRR